MAGRHRKLTDATTKHYTKEELEQRRKAEEKLNEYEKLEVKDAPKHLDKLAKAEWKRIIVLLEKLPVSRLDRTTIALYCTYCSVYEQASIDLKERGSIVDGKANPSLAILNSASKEIRALANSMGLNINARLKIVMDEKDEVVADPFMDLMD